MQCKERNIAAIYLHACMFIVSQYMFVNACIVEPLYNKIIFSEIPTKGTPWLAREGELWDVFCELIVWPKSCRYHWHAICNIVLQIDCYSVTIDRAIREFPYIFFEPCLAG